VCAIIGLLAAGSGSDLSKVLQWSSLTSVQCKTAFRCHQSNRLAGKSIGAEREAAFGSYARFSGLESASKGAGDGAEQD
jgi:hypothetical protein